jgi:hypothetical protein
MHVCRFSLDRPPCRMRGGRVPSSSPQPHLDGPAQVSAGRAPVSTICTLELDRLPAIDTFPVPGIGAWLCYHDLPGGSASIWRTGATSCLYESTCHTPHRSVFACRAHPNPPQRVGRPPDAPGLPKGERSSNYPEARWPRAGGPAACTGRQRCVSNRSGSRCIQKHGCCWNVELSGGRRPPVTQKQRIAERGTRAPGRE